MCLGVFFFWVGENHPRGQVIRGAASMHSNSPENCGYDCPLDTEEHGKPPPDVVGVWTGRTFLFWDREWNTSIPLKHFV